ncbi:MAG: hypothetical protein A2020_06275 [Lentisphaerae bacterium GWF2_45_14]|nr:MAG: hypothetical protein A2020_06275 [Lentisphaerae bacterium GWF2_45_14]
MAEQFKSVFSIPYFLMSFGDDTGACPLKEKGKKLSFSGAGKRLSIDFSGVLPAPSVRETEKTVSVIIAGFPVIDEIAGRGGLLDELASKPKPEANFIRKIDGEFLFIHFDKSSGKLFIVNDRFTSMPLFYHIDSAGKTLTASPYFTCLWRYLSATNQLRIEKEAFFEFLWFQRLFGTKTYAKDAYFLPDASILEFGSGPVRIENYWKRNYEKSRLSLNDHSHRMAELTKKSVRWKTEDGKRYGHFLSGGMDSRSVLAAFEDNFPVCFTATVGENRELRIAREIAITKGSQHLALELDEEHYGKILRPSVEVIGGMYNYDHGLFYGFNEAVNTRADVCFHGHGFDYMFQGMYIPGKNLNFQGRTLYYRTMMEPPEDLTNFFIENASYRIKKANIWKYIAEDKKLALREFQQASINGVLERGKELTSNRFDLWEYLTFHHLSRHYSYPNHASIATFSEQRTISFINELFDLYLTLPAEHRFNGRIEKKCLQILDKRLAHIWSANTNLPVTASCLKQTLYQIAGFAKRRIFPERQDADKEWAERTWPTRDYALRNQETLKNAVKSLCSSDTLDSLGFFDMTKLKKDFPKWIDGENVEGVSGDLVQTVLTIGTFLNMKNQRG